MTEEKLIRPDHHLNVHDYRVMKMQHQLQAETGRRNDSEIFNQIIKDLTGPPSDESASEIVEERKDVEEAKRPPRDLINVRPYEDDIPDNHRLFMDVNTRKLHVAEI